MVNEVKTGNSTLDIIKSQNADTSAQKTKKRDDEVQREDFLQILVTQLKNQDPLDPMSNDQFAVDLAQFSQLEQLINLNEKFDKSGGAESLAQYLGHKVGIASDSIELDGERTELLEVKLSSQASVSIDLKDSVGQVVETLQIGMLPEGSTQINLSELTDRTGKFNYEINGLGTTGDKVSAEGLILGEVSGFIPGPQGALLVGDKEVSMEDVRVIRS